MTAKIQRLLVPPSELKSQDRALTYINDNFRSLAQVEDEGALRNAVDETYQKTEGLRAQLQESQDVKDEHISTSLAKTREYLASAQEISLSQHTLTDEITNLASELESALTSQEKQPRPTLLEELESLHRNLRELETVRTYIAVVELALRLSKTAVAQVRQTLSASPQPSFSPSALTEYCRLQSLVSAVCSACSAVENPSQSQPYVTSAQDESQPLNLVTFLVRLRNRTWKDIKEMLSKKLLDVTEKMGWPQAINYHSVSSVDRALFESAFVDLLRLQDAGRDAHASDATWESGSVYPIQILATPIALRFKFHFESKRETNRLDKPEWYFTHMLNVVHTHLHFLETHIQALLSNTSYKHINAFKEFTLHLLPSLSRKLRHSMPQLLNHPSLLAHTIYQALAFDASLKEQGFSLEGTTSESPSSVPDGKSEGWLGISDQILGKREWFETWLEGESKFADDQYNEIISSPDAWQLTDDGDDDELRSDLDGRPTQSARRLKALIEQITDRYQPLPRFAARTRFLIAIQIPILESYHSRISSSLDAFETLSSSFVRVVPGAITQVGHAGETRRLTSGVEGVGRLIKACLSANFVATEMEHWGDEVFFLELWAEINSRAALRTRAEEHPLLPDPMQEPAAKAGIEAISNGTIFQELVTQYRNLAGRAEDMIVRHICSEVESDAKPYFFEHWDTSNNASPDESSISVPTTLVAPLSRLSTHLDFLARSLPLSLANALYRRIVAKISGTLLQKRLMQCGVGKLTLSEAKKIAEEIFLWVQACRVAVGRVIRRVEGPWTQLLDTVKLVTLEPEPFRNVVERIFSTAKEGLEGLQDELDLNDLDLSRMKDVVRLREECWR